VENATSETIVIEDVDSTVNITFSLTHVTCSVRN